MAKRGGGLGGSSLIEILKKQIPKLEEELRKDTTGTTQAIREAEKNFNTLIGSSLQSKEIVKSIISGDVPTAEQIAVYKSEEEARAKIGIKSDVIYGKVGSVTGFQTPGLKLPSQISRYDNESLSASLARQGITYPLKPAASISERYTGAIPRGVLEEELSSQRQPRLQKRQTAGAAYVPFGETKELFVRF